MLSLPTRVTSQVLCKKNPDLIDSCDRLFLEEFEDLNRLKNTANEAEKILSYSQEICGKKGF